MAGGKHSSGVFSMSSSILRKIKRLLVRNRVPRFLHAMGPKTYEFADHALALLLRVVRGSRFKLSFKSPKRSFARIEQVSSRIHA